MISAMPFQTLVDGFDAQPGKTPDFAHCRPWFFETPVNEAYNLNNHPELTDMLTMAPTCEGRLPFLYVKQAN